MNLTVVIPMYNESAIVADTMKTVERWLAINFPTRKRYS